jgi:4-hydroxybenzoate polyprenyltransferase
MIRKFVEKLEDTPMSFIGWATAFVGVVSIRFFFEMLSSPSPAFPAAPDVSTMIHYLLFFIGAFVSCALIVNVFVPNIGRITKIILFISPVLWLPPIIDLICSGGGGYAMAYIFTGGSSLLRDLLTFNGSSPFGGMTPGIKTELASIVIGVACYVFIKTKNIIKTILAALFCYCLVFFWMAIPSILAMIMVGSGQTISVSASQVFNAVVGVFYSSHIPSDIFRPVEQVGYAYGIGLIFNAGLSHLFYLIDSILLGLWFFSFRRVAAMAVLKNIRPGRALHFGFMVLVGVGAAMVAGGRFVNWVDGMVLATILIAFFCAWLFSVGTNDAVDVAIDSVSNAGRPLVTGALSVGISRATNAFFLAWALIGGFVAGYWTLFLILVFLAAYYVYSIPPLRLKRVPILATFLIALASLSAAMAGFYFLSPGKLVSEFPGNLLLIILIFFTLCTNIKDVKDISGDRANGVTTIPVVFGEKLGRRIVGLLFALSFVLMGAIARSPLVMAVSVVAAVSGYVVVVAGKYREWPAFVVYFAYALAVAVLIMSRIV